MKRKIFAVVTLVWFLSIGAAAPVRMTPVKITEGVYMFEHSQGSGNSTVVITDDGVLVFDFHIDNADQTLAGIRKLTDKKVKYLISSHSAGDHASGAWHFREDKPVYIATKNQVHDFFKCRSGRNSTSARIPTIHGTRLTKKGNWFGPTSALTVP